jgi:microsomal prostaglandin-E synthase 1
MIEWLASGAGPAFLVCCVLVYLEMAALAFATPLLRMRRNVWLNEEDARRFSGAVSDVEDRDVARLVRAHRNQLENFVPFFALGLLWIASRASSSLGAALFVAFTLARVAHSVFYLAHMGRSRTAAHTVSFLVLVILAGGAVWRLVAGS